MTSQEYSFERETQLVVLPAMRQKGVRGDCPMCGHEGGMATEGFVQQPLFVDSNTEPSYTSRMLIVRCDQCGFSAHFDMDTLTR